MAYLSTSYQSGDGIIPIFNISRLDDSNNINIDEIKLHEIRKRYSIFFFDVSWEELVVELYFNKIKSLLKSRLSNAKVKEKLNSIGYCNSRKNAPSLVNRIFNDSSFKASEIDNSNELCDIIFEFQMVKNIFQILPLINDDLEKAFKGVLYIAPLRAASERYYRHQDLQVDEIDHTGSNLVMLLKSFSSEENNHFTNWTSKNFGFFIRVESIGLHYSIKIKSINEDEEYNINDMGFGYSQVLPIIVSLWLGLFRKDKKTNCIIFAIEQPELHLHPEYQAKLSVLFSHIIKIAKKKKIDLRIIFETHSKTMIDTLGDCIEDKIIEKDDVNIVLFQKESNLGTVVSFSGFNEQGFLSNWPIGFFAGRI